MAVQLPFEWNTTRCESLFSRASCDTVHIYTCVHLHASELVFPTTRWCLITQWNGSQFNLILFIMFYIVKFFINGLTAVIRCWKWSIIYCHLVHNLQIPHYTCCYSKHELQTFLDVNTCEIVAQFWECTNFLGQGPFVLFLVPRVKDKIMILNLENQALKTEIKIYLTSRFFACGFILLPSELFQIVINCKIFNSSVKFKLIHKIAVIHKKFLVLFNPSAMAG